MVKITNKNNKLLPNPTSSNLVQTYCQTTKAVAKIFNAWLERSNGRAKIGRSMCAGNVGNRGNVGRQ
ncbi:hypothetical protein [Candidatus Bartonella washoeensis]|uniref:hypothetical protein n=1 Tax=Candidatus Bartonella washoeensis TaxID=186739 RepID=UPI00030DA199|nr:hypothetical protein [Bartonella washoeensis]